MARNGEVLGERAEVGKKWNLSFPPRESLLEFFLFAGNQRPLHSKYGSR